MAQETGHFLTTFCALRSHKAGMSGSVRGELLVWLRGEKHQIITSPVKKHLQTEIRAGQEKSQTC